MKQKDITRGENGVVTSSHELKSVSLRQRELLDIVETAAENSQSDNTRRSYEYSWDVFDRFCESMRLIALPAEPMTVALFLADQYQNNLSVSTLSQRIAAIRSMHLGNDYLSPTDSEFVKDKMKGFRNLKGTKQSAPKDPATEDIIIAMLDAIDTSTLLGMRDRALLLYGYAGALRRSELVGIDVEHIKPVPLGHELTIPRSKGDQQAKGQKIGVMARSGSPLCPTSAVDEWLKASGIQKGSVFRRFYKNDTLGATRLGDKTVERLVKELAFRIGLSMDRFAAHSLRSGFLTSAADSGARWDKLREHARHRRLDTTAGYIKSRELFDDHAGARLDEES